MVKNIGVSVGDVMTREFISVKPETSILDCARLMMKKNVGSLVLEKQGLLRGIITEKDIIWAVSKKKIQELGKVKCGDISPRKLVTIKPNADLMTAIKLMQKSKFRRLPVVLKNRLVGVLTLKDILRIEPDLFDIACSRNLFSIREENQKTNRKKHGSFDYGFCEECGEEKFLEVLDSKKLCSSCIEKI